MGSVGEHFHCPMCGRHAPHDGYAADWIGYPMCGKCLDTVESPFNHRVQTLYAVTGRGQQPALSLETVRQLVTYLFREMDQPETDQPASSAEVLAEATH